MYIAKRIFKIFGTLALAGVIYAAGAYVPPDYSILDKTPPPPPPPVYIPEEPDPVYTDLGAPGIIEYGSPVVINNNNDPLHAYIRYPQAGNPADEHISKWAHELFNGMMADYGTGIEFDPINFGEINVHFDSYLIDNRYAGVHQYGQFSYGTTEQPKEIFKTFNIDLTRFELLEPGDILDLESPDSVLSLLSLRLLVEHPKTDGYHVFVDESWLSYIYITHEGIKVILPHGEFLPDSFETLTVTLPYADLGLSLLIRKDAPLPDMPTPAPEATPAPDPTPAPSGPQGETLPDSDGDDEDEGGDTDGDTGNGNGDGNDGDGSDGDAGDGDGDNGDDTNGEGVDGDTDDNNAEEPPPTAAPQSSVLDRDKPVIALTFDDGPSEYMEELLDIISHYNIRATFFTIGNIAHTHSESLQRAVSLKCEVAGHSWNHKNLAKMTAEDVGLQIETTGNAIEEITGIAPSFFRPPYGAVSDTMKNISEELGISMIKWNVDAEDWKSRDADEIYERVMEQVSDKAIILSHDIYEATLEAYKRLIPDLLSEGYQLITVTELLKIEHGSLTPGHVYYSGVKVDMVG